MFVNLKLSSNLPVGTVVQYNAENSFWEPATSVLNPIGVVSGIPFEAEESSGIFYAKITFSGCCFALSSRDIQSPGGWLNVENGKVFVDQSATEHCGLISPVSNDNEVRLSNTLVMIHLR